MLFRSTFSCSSHPFGRPLLQVASGARGTKEVSHKDTKVGAGPRRHGGPMELEEPAGKASPPMRSANGKEAEVKVCLQEWPLRPILQEEGLGKPIIPLHPRLRKAATWWQANATSQVIKVIMEGVQPGWSTPQPSLGFPERDPKQRCAKLKKS